MIGVVSMARLKMVGIINENEIIKYQKYNTNKKMTLINNDKDNIQIKAIPICVFLIILCNVVLFLKLFNSNISIKPIFIILGFLIGACKQRPHPHGHPCVLHCRYLPASASSACHTG